MRNFIYSLAYLLAAAILGAPAAQAGADYKAVSQPGTMHSFINPAADEYGKKFDLPLAYNEEADKDSWKRLDGILVGLFGKRK